ncbi:MAG: phospholipid-binding protein [Alphaproteobacteria bacterium]|nr:phospholipid-binding protein [Alphaproteobacteria bacterium]
MLFVCSTVVPASAFGVSFTWGNIPRCTTGNPKTVASPNFSLSGVPKGTVKLRFALKDLNAPYNHGGGTVAYSGGSRVPSGAFTYKSPCPPNGTHTYQWTVTALDAGGKTLGKATAKRPYP